MQTFGCIQCDDGELGELGIAMMVELVDFGGELGIAMVNWDCDDGELFSLVQQRPSF